MTYVHGRLMCDTCGQTRNVKGRPDQTVTFTYRCPCGAQISHTHTFASVN